jgi:hypothetical protein
LGAQTNGQVLSHPLDGGLALQPCIFGEEFILDVLPVF